jgi:hypothetical protein
MEDMKRLCMHFLLALRGEFVVYCCDNAFITFLVGIDSMWRALQCHNSHADSLDALQALHHWRGMLMTASL